MPWSRASASALVRSRNQRSPSTACQKQVSARLPPRRATPPALREQQLRGEPGQFPGDVERGTIGNHVEPFWQKMILW